MPGRVRVRLLGFQTSLAAKNEALHSRFSKLTLGTQPHQGDC